MYFTAFAANITAIPVYFPNSSCRDEEEEDEIQKVYERISEEATLRKKQRRNILLAGDFNARAGAGEGTSVRSSAGPYGYGAEQPWTVVVGLVFYTVKKLPTLTFGSRMRS